MKQQCKQFGTEGLSVLHSKSFLSLTHMKQIHFCERNYKAVLADGV
jgi:hypothetical protein